MSIILLIILILFGLILVLCPFISGLIMGYFDGFIRYSFCGKRVQLNQEKYFQMVEDNIRLFREDLDKLEARATFSEYEKFKNFPDKGMVITKKGERLEFEEKDIDSCSLLTKDIFNGNFIINPGQLISVDGGKTFKNI